jgi:hypothetical protein
MRIPAVVTGILMSVTEGCEGLTGKVLTWR